MSPETPQPASVDRESPAEREAAYSDFRIRVAEHLVAQNERTHTYLNVRQLGEPLRGGGLGYIEAEIPEDERSGDPISKLSVMVPDRKTGNYRDGAVIYEADLPYGEVRKFEVRRNLSPRETQRAVERSESARSMAVATASTIQLARAEILADQPEGYDGEPASAAEIRELLERLPGHGA